MLPRGSRCIYSLTMTLWARSSETILLLIKCMGCFSPPPAPRSLGSGIRPARGSLRLNFLQGHHCSFPSSVCKVDGNRWSTAGNVHEQWWGGGVSHDNCVNRSLGILFALGGWGGINNLSGFCVLLSAVNSGTFQGCKHLLLFYIWFNIQPRTWITSRCAV